LISKVWAPPETVKVPVAGPRSYVRPIPIQSPDSLVIVSSVAAGPAGCTTSVWSPLAA
jgi:hypothetical protein